MSLQTGGAPGAAPTPVVLTAPEGAPVVIPDTHSLFDAEFARDGRDLVISNPGAPELRISGYFHPAQPADLQSPDGAVLRGDLAARLAGPEAPGQYAQAGLPQGADPIGQVETVGGEASVQRTDGVREPLTVGTKIFLDDVIETGSGGTLSVTFVDGTIFTLSPGSRMIIDELVYTPAGQSNSGSFNLIQGGFVFIAGQVARTGGMDVNTPAATMGIRGTTVLAEIETRGGVSTAEITLTPDPDGQVGRVALFDLGGNLITTITDTSTKWIVSTLEGDTREVARSAEDAQADNVLIAEAVAAYDSAQARFQSGGSFIELNTLRGNAPNPSGPDEEDGGVDLDSIDDPLAPELSPEDAPEQSPQRPTLDEGRNQLDPEPEQRTIVVTGFEDLNEDSRIAGALNPDPARASLTLQSLPANGTVTIGPGGTFVYLPDPDFNGSDEFTYVLTDAEGVVEVGTVKITVLPVNDAPQIGDQRIAGVEDTVVTGQAQGRDVDGDALVYSLAGAAAHGTVSVAQDGSWTYRPEADFAGSDSFRIAVADGAGGLAAQVVTVAVSGSPDAPVVTSALADARGRLIEGAAREVSGKLTASDADAGATLAWSGSTAGAWGAFVIAADGAWSYQAGAAAESLAAGQTVTERFTATVTDDQGDTAKQVVTVTLTGTNDGPVITSGPGAATRGALENGAAVGGRLVASDADSGATLSWSGSAAGAWGAFVIAADGAWSYQAGAAAEALVAGQQVTERFTATVTDDQGETAKQVVTVTLTGTNDGPVITSGPGAATRSALENGAAVGGRLVASDADSGATLAWTGSAAGTWGAFVIAADGAWSYQAGAAAESLAAGQTVTERFTATVTDDQGATATQVVTVTVTGTNDGPIADALNATFAQDSVLSGTLVARDADSGDTLTFAQGATAPAHGTVTIQPDGAFTYTPQPGFSGLDRFSFLVTDASGATSEAQATLAVNAVPTKASNGQTVTLDIRFDPDPGVAPAGSLVASVSELDAGNVNLVIALDRSGSVGAANWQTAIDDVADALDKLAARFVGAETKVTVQVIPYASTASVAGTFDLTDPDLITTVRNLPFTGGGTNWTAALDRTESFLDGQSAGDLNYLYFVSDGEPSNASWRAVFDRLTDSAAKGYELQVEAFGIGGKVDLATLGLMDTTPTILSGADELAQAFGATPLFSAQLVDLSVTMIVDGIDLGQIADETAAGLETSGFTTRLALAEIPGFVDLLGRENLVTATAGFDLDGDPDTVEFQLASSQLFTRAASAQTLTGTDGSDLLFGSDRNDVLNGGEGNDILLGFGGDDRLRTGGGLDVVRAGAGDDRIIVDRSDAPDGAAQESLRGGSGRDVLAVAFGGDLNDRLLDLVDLRGVEAVDMDNGKANALSLSLEDVLAFSNEADTLLETLLGEPLPESLTVIGDAKDSLELVAGETGAFVDTGTSVTDPDGNSLSVFRYVKGSEVLATLAVDADVTVTLQPVG